MAAKRYKSLWSRLGPNGDRIEVVETGPVVQLRVNGVWQGEIDRSSPRLLPTPYMQYMMLALCYAAALRRFLVIGLGTGCLPKALHAVLPKARIDVVEIDPLIVDVARRFFAVPSVRTDDKRAPGIRIHVADGAAFLEDPPVTYDVIFVDAFTGGELPAPLRTRRTMWLLRRALAPGGAVAFNLARTDPYAVHEVGRHMRALLGPPRLMDPRNAERHDDLNLVLLAPTPHDLRRLRARTALLHAHRDLLAMDVPFLLSNELQPAAVAELADFLIGTFLGQQEGFDRRYV